MVTAWNSFVGLRGVAVVASGSACPNKDFARFRNMLAI
jgi:hypothetical protein